MSGHPHQTGMTPERLAEVRANLPDPSADLSRRERDSHALLDHVDHLTAEIDRLTRQLIVRTDQRDVLQQENRTLRQMAVLGERAENARLREGIEALHVKHEMHLCGAMSEVPHRHGDEQEPYPFRLMVCTREGDHEGPHRDAICCWNFQEFTEHAAYKSSTWADRSSCTHCQTAWPCPTAALLNPPTEGETDGTA